MSLTLTGALDSLAIEGRGSLERFQLGDWRVPAARAHAMFEPGPVPVFVLDAAADSIALGRLGFGAAAAVARGSRDSLTWFARSRVGELGAFLAGGRLARDSAGLAVGIDSLAVLLPGGVWFLERPTELHLGDSVISVGAGALKNGAGPGRLVLRGDLPARGSAAANLQLEEFPVAALYALFQRDTLGVGGTLTATLGLSGSRAEPTYTGSFVLHEGTFGEFHAPFLDGSLEYRGRRLDGELHLWRTGKQVLTVTAHLPLDLALQPVAQRQLPDTLAVRAAADSVDLSLLEAVTPLLTQVRGAFTADLGIGGTWDNPPLRGGLTIDSAAATIPALGVRYEQVHGRLRLSGDTIAVDSLALAGGKGRAVVTDAVVLERLTHPRLALAISAQEFKAQMGIPANTTIYRSFGCRECRNTGFYGRHAIFEWMDSDDEIRRLILKTASTDQIRDAARRTGMCTLAEDGWRLVRMGITTVDEVLSVTTAKEVARSTKNESLDGVATDETRPGAEVSR